MVCAPNSMLSRHSLAALSNTVPSRSLHARAGIPTNRHLYGRPETSAPSKQLSRKSSAENTVAKYRSKHYNKEPNPDGKIFLEPHILSGRLKKLCDRAQVDTAVAMLKNSPLDAQNVPVWNTLIWECLKAERFRLAHDLYIDVRPIISARTVSTVTIPILSNRLDEATRPQTKYPNFSNSDEWSSADRGLGVASKTTCKCTFRPSSFHASCRRCKEARPIER